LGKLLDPTLILHRTLQKHEVHSYLNLTSSKFSTLWILLEMLISVKLKSRLATSSSRKVLTLRSSNLEASFGEQDFLPWFHFRNFLATIVFCEAFCSVMN
jgi:hypothetical protein